MIELKVLFKALHVSTLAHLGECLSPARDALAGRQPTGHTVPVVQVAESSCKLGEILLVQRRGCTGTTGTAAG